MVQPRAEAESGTSTALWLVPAGAPGLHVPAGPDPTGTATRTIAADPVRVPSTALLRLLPALPGARPEHLLPLD